MGELGGDVGIPAHGGISGKYSWSISESGKLNSTSSPVVDQFEFKSSNDNTRENYYFKIVGEHSAQSISARNYMGGDGPVNVKVEKQYHSNGQVVLDFGAGFLDENGENLEPSLIPSSQRTSRKLRGTSIVQVKNGELADDYSGFNEFRFSYLDGASVERDYKDVRNGEDAEDPESKAHEPHHTAGFLVTNTSGVRYNYCLPAYNKKHIETAFSVPVQDECNQRVENIPTMAGNSNEINYKANSSSDEFLKETELPSYAHSYLLTSILGTDYIDVNNNGVDDADKGYWVKFNYQRTDDEFKWRAPFVGANYLKGHDTDDRDDKGSFMYGEKELWYVASVETATHKAVFYTSPRDDGRGAANYIQNDGDNIVDGKSQKLDKIVLFSKKDMLSPIQTTHFEYADANGNEYTLCKGVINNDNSNVSNNNGKLTLRKLYTTYGSNTRGELNAYRFHYHGDGSKGINPDYSTYKIDRWGNYKPVISDCGEELHGSADQTIYENQNVEYPYVDQSTSKTDIDNQNSAWHLYKVELPSGSTLEVDYESDDYAYVQNKQAMQMFEIAQPPGSSAPEGVVTIQSFEPTAEERRVYFDLEEPIPSSAGDDLVRDLYSDGTGYLYYRIRINLRNSSPPDNIDGFEHIAGYARVANWGFDDGSIDNQHFTRGYVELDWSESENRTHEDYHPFSLAAWQYLRSTYPTMLYNVNELPNGIASETGSKEDLGKLRGMKQDLKNMFRGFYTNAQKNNWGEEIDIDRSWIRLNSPDKLKFGGGCRVKQITINDGWSNLSDGEPNSTYGTIYDYSVYDNELGKDISSGVAAYEPFSRRR